MGWLPHVTRRLYELAYAMGDFEGLKVPTEATILHAWRVAADLFQSDTATPNVIPNEYGHIEFVWHKARWELAIEVSEDKVGVWARHPDTKEMIYGSLVEHKLRVVDILREISDG